MKLVLSLTIASLLFALPCAAQRLGPTPGQWHNGPGSTLNQTTGNAYTNSFKDMWQKEGSRNDLANSNNVRNQKRNQSFRTQLNDDDYSVSRMLKGKDKNN